VAQAFAELSVAQIQAGLTAKEFSAKEVAENSLARIVSADKAVHAFLETTEEAALAAAARVDAAIVAGDIAQAGPLAGVPVAFKDNMNLEGTHTTCSSRMLENYVSPYTATCVSKIIEAGGIPLGKLNMDEFAFGSSTETSAFGRTFNPWDLERVPGGSSGGSSAAVAAGLATLTLGSDTGGSIRQPGSFCGTVAVKPTYGVVSRYGVVAFGSSLDQVGPFARNVQDAALAMNALAGHDPLDCTSQPVTTDFTANLAEGVSGMRIGVVPAFMEAEGLAPEVRAKVEEAVGHLRQMGAEIIEVELPNAQAAMSAYYVLGPCEAFSNLARFDSVRYGYCEPGCKDLGHQYEASRSAGFGPDHVGQLSAFRGRIRKVLLPGSAGSYPYHSGLRESIRKGRLHHRSGCSAHRVQVRRNRGPHLDVPFRYVHHFHQHRWQRRHEHACWPGCRFWHARGRSAH
jgi:aspartyl-tRNA(Asn)/glutamyl-tRNA(Gln) amidotransferase subunit A